MKTTLLAMLAWAIVIHTISGGKQAERVIDIQPSRLACMQEMKNQHISGDCYEVVSIIHGNAI